MNKLKTAEEICKEQEMRQLHDIINSLSGGYYTSAEGSYQIRKSALKPKTKSELLRLGYQVVEFEVQEKVRREISTGIWPFRKTETVTIFTGESTKFYRISACCGSDDNSK